ncbi:MAG TPA: hypothetical protein GXZ59_07790 [Clostridiaceae bacterium]|nr:hypothetical protein [Clostridiaceae bacterium]
MIDRNKRQSGMATLEAAIILPLTLTMVFFMLSAIRLVREDSLIRYAVDQTCEEMSLLLPAAEALLSPLASDTEELNDFIADLLPLQEAGEIVTGMAVDLGSSLAFSHLINSRIDYWLDEARAGLNLDYISHGRQIFLNWDNGDHVIWLTVNYSQHTLLGNVKKSTQAVIPIWSSGSLLEEGPSDGQEDEQQSDIWSESNFQRGQEFREMFGGNLPFNFPVIACWDGSTATAIKSMDLTAPSYESVEGADTQLQRYLLELASFQGASLISKGQEYSVSADQIDQKRLILVIPGNYPGWLDQSQRNYWQAVGADCGIQLEIREYGTSLRYQKPETEP